MERESDEDFTIVKRKKKKAKIDSDNCDSASLVHSSPSRGSTSSTNTSSMKSDDPRRRVARRKTQKNILNQVQNIASGNHPVISVQARRFAETRFAFPPFILRFNEEVNESAIINDLTSYFKNTHAFDLTLAGHRLKGKRELLLFVNNRDSFARCFEDRNWPATIGSHCYEKSRPNHLPPQFSVVLRNVPMDFETNELLTSLKEEFPDALTAHRILSKDKQPTSFVRIDIQSGSAIDAILKKKFIYVNNNRLAVTEYLAPAKVLVCNRCFQIGHFRSTCRSELEHCKSCGVGVKDIIQHKDSCDKTACCVRCKGAHESNDARCPVILAFRAQLTRSLLTTNNGTNQATSITPGLLLNEQDFPALVTQKNGSGPIRNLNFTHANQGNHLQQLDEIECKVKTLDIQMKRLIELNNSITDQAARTHQLILNHDKDIQINRIESTFQKEFISQYVSPICQAMVEIIPSLVQQNSLQDNTLLCPSLTGLCAKMANDLPTWTSRFAKNEATKARIAKEYDMMDRRTAEAHILEESNTSSMN